MCLFLRRSDRLGKLLSRYDRQAVVLDQRPRRRGDRRVRSKPDLRHHPPPSSSRSNESTAADRLCRLGRHRRRDVRGRR
ncbi:MAG: hypothetical protein MZU97_14415 [Bacillus subtilis]|nr:hypothetical protein [Bacillus subtilis]